VNNVTRSRFVDAAGERIMTCSAPAVPPDLGGAARAASLAHVALTRLVESIDAAPRTALVLAASERYAAGATSFTLTGEGEEFIKAMRAGMPPALKHAEIEIFPFGRAGGAVALRRALELVDGGRLVIWGGVDTLHDWTTLEALERTNRLMTVANIDGVRPGEGAAFLGVVRSAADGVQVLGLGTGREPVPVGSDEPCHSLGLSAALDDAVAPLRAAGRRTNCWLLDNSHEAYATIELQNVIARFGDVIGLQTDLQMPLQELGDVGAAALPLLAVLSAEAWRLGYANDDTAVMTGCSQNGARGALLLGAPDNFRPVEMVA
jgi:3-oxoacyl-[acyl-carrier-protein] synthase I